MRSQQFDDFDAFAGSVRDADFGMLLQNTRHRVWTISQVDLGGVGVQFGQEGSGNITEGRSRSDGYLFFVPFTNAAAHAANGVALDESSIAILEPGVDFCLSSKIEHDWCSVFIPTDRLNRGRGHEKPWPDLEKATCRVMRSDRQFVDRLRQSVRQVFTAASTCRQFETAAAAQSAAENLLNVSSLILGRRSRSEPQHEGRPVIPRNEIIRRSRAWLEQRDGQRIVIGELANAAGVSERTLRSVFNEYYGVGPVRYLQLRQLHLVHRALQNADPNEVMVGQVLTAHGEWEFSRFAARYRRLFGELPSETLQSSRCSG